MSDARRMWLMVGAVTVVIFVAIAVYLFVNRPWESQEYKDCVRTAQAYLGKDYNTSAIKQYCHQIYD